MSEQSRRQSGSSPGLRTRIKHKEPSLYKVIMHNDDVTTMDFVVEILVQIFDKSQTQAVELMMKVHREGSALIARYPYDIACTKQRQALDRARASGFPFKISVEKE